MDRSPPGSSVHGILQARILEWVALPFSRGSFQPRDGTQVSHIAGGFFPSWATREVLNVPNEPGLYLSLAYVRGPLKHPKVSCLELQKDFIRIWFRKFCQRISWLLFHLFIFFIPCQEESLTWLLKSLGKVYPHTLWHWQWADKSFWPAKIIAKIQK